MALQRGNVVLFLGTFPHDKTAIAVISVLYLSSLQHNKANPMSVNPSVYKKFF